MGIADARSHRLIEVNDAWVNTYGFSREEALGRTAHELGIVGSEEERQVFLEQAIRPATGAASEIRVRGKNGKPIDVMVRTAAIEINGRACVLSTSIDITERKQAEQALHASEATLRGILNAANESIWLFSVDGVALAGNRTALARWGGPPETIIGKSIHEFMPSELGRSRLARLQEVARTGNPVEFEDCRAGITFEHTFYPVIGENGRVDRVAVFSRDITERRRTEVALHESEQHFRLLHETMLHGIVFHDAEGKIVSMNPAARRILGQTEEKLQGIHSVSIHEDGSPFPTSEHPTMVSLRTGEVVRGVVMGVYNPAEGRHRWLDITTVPLFHEGEAKPYQVYALFADITERRQAAGTLRRYELLASQSRDIVLFVERDSGRILEANAAALSSYGYTREQILSLTISDLRAPETRSLTQQQMAKADGDGILFETVHRRKDGSTFPVEVSSRGAMVDGTRMLISLVRDITERKRAELELIEAHARTTAILESIADAFYSLDTEWRFVQVNPAAQRAPFGRPESELVGKIIWDVYPDIVGSPVYSHYLNAVNNRSREHYEAQSPLNGRWYEVYMVPRTGGLDVYLRDIDDRKQAEAALRAANLQLAEANQRKNEFLAVLSHELRNPLTPIRNSLHVLEHTVPGTEKAKHAEEVIRRQTDQLARLIDDLLDVTRISSNKIRLQCRGLGLNDLVRRTLDDHRSLFEENGIRLETSLTDERLSLYADEARLTQVVGNLLHNAAKFTSTGGLVRISTALDATRRLAILRVSDNGAGIGKEILPRLFQPFMQADSTLDRSKGGLGLGLALVKGLVEMHGGEVRAHSDGAGKGTELVVELPLEGTPAPQTSTALVATKGRSRRVLIIEDNTDAAESLREVLEFSAHIVEIANNGHDGLAKARKFKPDIVLCDIGLPGMDGFAVARAFRADESLKKIALVALSGYALPEDQQHAAEAGFQRHLAKPPSLEKLEQLLAELPIATKK